MLKTPSSGRITTLSCALVFLAQLGTTLYLPALPRISSDIGLSESASALSLAVYFAGCAAPVLAWGALADRYGRKAAILSALMLFSAAGWIASAAATPFAFLSARAMQGVGAGGMAVLGRILIRDTASGAHLAKRMTLLSFAFVLALGGGQFLGGVLQECFSWRSLFLMLTASGGVLLLLAPFVRLAPMQAQTNSRASRLALYWRCLQCPPFAVPMLIGGLGYGILLAFQAIAPFVFQRDLGMSARQFGDMGIWLSAAYLLGSLLVNALALAIGTDRLIRAGLLTMLASGIGLAGIAGFSEAGVLIKERTGLMTLLYCAINFSQAVIFPSSLAGALSTVANNKGQVTALCSFSQQIVASAVAGLASLAKPFGMLPVTGLVILVAALGLLMAASMPANPPEARGKTSDA
ncbi:MFS transporter [Ralstonia solanacearum]|uniref:MFS transporter n=1 Tax=Ralstonia solanacearum TaxID=305 RepID=UPI00078D1602|nr:MFS transporter [Ralstonia solanacearum]AMP40370.1 hypothetical protein LBM2029_22825 [Ralstonia solanacearum]AXV89231.1 MFS transporter [Ralstonia solanacearum]AXW08696.1 MFS transporter [Ralstonia solanacearum]AXW26479.1 MFS transporter [Ralstonia solanacearum]AXW83395.1 MFS transporter [Ralstonia solanacearum]